MFNKTLSFALIALVLCACKKPAKTYEIKAPFKNVALNSTTKTINPAEAQVVKFDKEFSVEVPQNAFRDADGNLITEPVELSVKKFNNSASIIASGIPMKVTDENGEEQQMESAGMFDIRGKSNGKDVFVADGKTLNIITKSSISGNDYDAYYFEETDISSQKMSILPSSSNQKKKAGRWKKLGGEKENKNLAVGIDSFVLNLDTAKNGILSMLNDVKWQTAYNHKFANPAKIDSLKNEKWKDVNFNEPERVIEFTELTFGEKQRVKITAFNNQIFIQDKKEIKFTNSGLVLSLSSAKEELSKVSIYDIKDNNIVVTTEAETFVFSLKGKLLNQLSGRFYPVFNKKYSTTLFQNFYTDKFYLLNKDGSLIIEGDSLKNAYFNRIEGEKPLLKYEYFERYYSRIFHAFLVKHKDGSQTIHSGNGDVIFNREQLSKGNVIGLSPNHRFAIMANKVGKFFIADIEQNKIYEQDFETSLEKSEKIRRTDIEFLNDKEFVFHQKLNFYEKLNYKPVLLWNIETGEKIASLGTYGHFSVGEQEIRCYNKFGYRGNVDDKKYFNFKGKEISIEKSFYGLSKIGKNYLKELSLVNSSNKIIKDFKAYDEDIKRAQVLDNQIYTSTKKGKVYCWDSVGTLLWSIDNKLNKDRTVRLINDDYLFCRIKKNITYFDRKGNLLVHCNNYLAAPGMNGFENFYVFLSTESGAQSARIKNEKRAKNIYEVQLSNNDRFFITYVAVDDENKSLIEKYQKALNQKSLRARKNKKTSNEFARKLSINQFGLYNYDRFYKNPDAIVFTADFEIPGTGFDVRETEVFQITGLNNRAVIRHNENSFDKFSIVKDLPNQLLVILPDEKVAVFSQEDFNNIEIEKLKKEKKYTFKLKILDKIESASQLASILNTEGV